MSFPAHSLSSDQARELGHSFLSRVYGWMSLALAVTAAIAWAVTLSPQILALLIQNPALIFVCVILEIILVIYLSARITHLSTSGATSLFLAYSALNGLTFALIFLAYTPVSIFGTFLITAGMFGACALYGTVTKKDLSTLGAFLFMALFGLILATLVNIFIASSTLYYLTSYAGVIIFAGLTAWDVQNLKHLGTQIDTDSENTHKTAILGALKLYLDFINLFLFLLRLFGNRR